MSIRRLLVGVCLTGAVLGLTAAPAFAATPKEDAKTAIEDAKASGAISAHTEECLVNALNKDDAEACQTAPKPILPATNELIWGIISFVLVLGALWKFALPMATKMMGERTERIRASIEEAEAAKVEAQTVLADYQRQLADARNEAARIVEEARQQAEQVRRDLTQRAEAEAADLRARNAEQVQAEAGRVQGELQQQVAGLAIELAERVVGASLDREANLRLIEDYINSVGTR